jgi:uncharacterized protein YjbI with pentapeptide repeats
MLKKFHSWQESFFSLKVSNKIGIFGLVVVVILLSAMAYFRFVLGWKWATGTGFEGKTIWDWLNLLIVPIALAGIALWFNSKEKRRELENAIESRREANLNKYIDRMGKFLLENELQKNANNNGSTIRDVAQVLTVTTLRILDAQRRDIVFRFLQDTHLAKDLLNGASFEDADLSRTMIRGINFRRADLRVCDLKDSGLIDVDFTNAYMVSANLQSSYLSNVNFLNADLRWADLSKSDFKVVSLRSTNLKESDLSESNFEDVDFTDANLEVSNLKGVNVSIEKLNCARSLKGAIMPDGSKHV